MDCRTLPTPARLTWLVGPPGAGKSTFAAVANHGFDRVVELTEILAPLVEPVGIQKGVLSANQRLVELIRELELRDENRALAPLLVVAGIVPRACVLPVREDEAVWLLLPDRERWERQFDERPAGEKLRPQYKDRVYAERWYDEFCSWEHDANVRRVLTPFERDRVGLLPVFRPRW